MSNQPTIRQTAEAAFETGALTAFSLAGCFRCQGKTTTALVLRFATQPAAQRFAQAQAVAHRRTIGVQRIDASYHVAVPVDPPRRPHPAAFRLWPASTSRSEFQQMLASAGLSMC